MGAGYDIGASASTSSAAQSGAATIGALTITGGGGASLLPKVPTTQAWVVYAVAGLVAIIALALFFRWKSSK
jgi:hypothetical protein